MVYTPHVHICIYIYTCNIYTHIYIYQHIFVFYITKLQERSEKLAGELAPRSLRSRSLFWVVGLKKLEYGLTWALLGLWGI